MQQHFRFVLVLFAILHAATALAQWQLQTTLNGNPPLYSISTVSDRVAWIGSFGSFDSVYRTTNGGANWIPTPTRPTSTEAIVYIKALSATTAFVGGGGPGAGGGNAKIYRTTNGGQNWSIVYTAAGAGSYWNAIHFFDAQNAIAFSDPPTPGGNFLIVKSTNAGVTWTPIANQPTPNSGEYGTQNMYFYDGLNGWFGTGLIGSVGTAGRVFRTTDGGNTWTGYPSGNTGWVADVRFVSPLVGIRISPSSPVFDTLDRWRFDLDARDQSSSGQCCTYVLCHRCQYSNWESALGRWIYTDWRRVHHDEH